MVLTKCILLLIPLNRQKLQGPYWPGGHMCLVEAFVKVSTEETQSTVTVHMQ